MQAGSNKECVDVLLPRCTPAQAYDLWLDVVWVGGGGVAPCKPRLVKRGDEKTFEGSIRKVPGNIFEEILQSNPGGTVEYHIKSGPFPVSYHRGVVEFRDFPCGNHPGTMVVWSCSYTPLLCCGWLVKLLIWISFRIMLNTLARRTEEKYGSLCR
eukprot:gnl/TRDRNA2_/TRDRNA2_54685_c0_seq1.p1 gnl/TRDRNA2_/TRDRNA2_54685_c0~~gnl/TRDRNA2_/TRDRNA2_54685_c0_seq1.p1  ORF type:complete len:155 (-),score=16.76 gnl/TRDRNA2_/TRDRNA2_54685_c0_seq1:28-492(-)